MTGFLMVGCIRSADDWFLMVGCIRSTDDWFLMVVLIWNCRAKHLQVLE